jgi:hypothetical protein
MPNNKSMKSKEKIKTSKKESLVDNITKRYRVTAREARDIVTAVSTAARTVTDPEVRGMGVHYVTKNGKRVKGGEAPQGRELTAKTLRNVAKQVGEVYTAATKGKSGTRSAQIKSLKSPAGTLEGTYYQLESKRKKTSKKK